MFFYVFKRTETALSSTMHTDNVLTMTMGLQCLV